MLKDAERYKMIYYRTNQRFRNLLTIPKAGAIICQQENNSESKFMLFATQISVEKDN